MQQHASLELQTNMFALTGIAALASVEAIGLTSEYVAKLHLLLAVMTNGKNSELLASPEDILDKLFNEYIEKKQENENRTIEAS